MSMRFPIVTSVLLAACLAACNPAPGSTKVPSTRKSGAPTTPGGSAAPVLQPSTGVITPGSGGAIISNNTGNLIGKVKAPATLISDKGVGLVSNNGGSAITNGGANYALLAAPEQVPLAGATVRLLDAAGAPIKGTDGQPLTALTDAQGNYGFQAALPTQNLVVEVALADNKGSVRAVVPREGAGQKKVEVDLISTLTTGYILNQYVRTQKDPLATFEKLPADVEATTRDRAASVLVGGAAAVPDALTNERVVATVDAMRAKDTTFDSQMETVKKLLVVAGASDLGTGLKATDVTVSNVDDLEIGPDGAMYLLATQDKRVWRVRPDGVIETAVGDRRPPGTDDLTGRVATEASLDRPTSISLDAQGRVLVSEARGVYRLNTDGKLARLTTRAGVEFAAGKNDEVIVTAIEAMAEYLEQGYPEALAPRAYVFYRCKPTGAPERLFEIVHDPEDDGTQTRFVRGLSWDGGNTLYVDLENHTVGKDQLLKYDLTTKTGAPDPNTPDGTLMLDGAGHVFDWTGSGTVRSRGLFQAVPEKTVPVPPEHASRLARAADGRVYAAKWGMVFRLDPTAAVRVAGTEGQGPPGDAGSFTFEVLSGAAVTPAGVVYAGDMGRRAVYQVSADRTITAFADVGGGNVQILRADPAGTLYMSDGNGNSIGKFDAQGTWTSVATTTGLIIDYVVAADGTIYASTVTLGTERQHKVIQLKNGTETVLDSNLPGAMLALDKNGVLHVAGGGTLKKREGSAWTVIKSDDRFSNAFTLGGGPGMAMDAQGRLYMTLHDQNKIVRYTIGTDVFQAIAGFGTAQFAGSGTDDGLNKPRTPCFDAAGNLYFADTGNRQVKRIAATDLP